MKYRMFSKASGGFTHVMSANAKCSIRLTNKVEQEETYTIKILDELDNEQATLATGTLASKASFTVEVILPKTYKLKLEAGDNVSTVVSKIAEVALTNGLVSQTIKTYKGDGVTTTFALGENAPANNSLELRVVCDDIYEAEYAIDYTLSSDKNSIEFLKVPYNGCDIKIYLDKQE